MSWNNETPNVEYDKHTLYATTKSKTYTYIYILFISRSRDNESYLFCFRHNFFCSSFFGFHILLYSRIGFLCVFVFMCLCIYVCRECENERDLQRQ